MAPGHRVHSEELDQPITVHNAEQGGRYRSLRHAEAVHTGPIEGRDPGTSPDDLTGANIVRAGSDLYVSVTPPTFDVPVANQKVKVTLQTSQMRLRRLAWLNV